MVTVPQPPSYKNPSTHNSTFPSTQQFSNWSSVFVFVLVFFLGPSRNHLFDMGQLIWSLFSPDPVILFTVFHFNLHKTFLFKHTALVFTFRGEFFLKVKIVLFVPPGICRDCRKSVFESSFSSVAGITSTDMEEGAAYGTPLTDLESLSRTLGHVALLWTIISQYTVTVVI